MLQIIAAITFSYLIGSIPTAYIFTRILKGADIRKLGSGNVGATNAMRALGLGWGLTVLSLDILKGFITVFFLGNFFAPHISMVSGELTRIILGFGCIAGHNWTIFLNFKGGKGIATGLGVLVALATEIPSLQSVLVSLLLTWVIVFAIFRTVSVASIFTLVLFPLYALIFKQPKPVIILSIILAISSLLRHLPNIKRILRGKESRLF